MTHRKEKKREFVFKLRPSTKAMFRLHGTKNLVLFLDSYLYFRHIHAYVNVAAKSLNLVQKTVSESTKKYFYPLISFATKHYHAKVTSYDDAKKIFVLDGNVEIPKSLSETVIPFDRANQIIFSNPKEIVAIDCSCRHVKNHDCEPAKRCLIIGEPYASFMMDHAKETNPVRITQQEALEILKTCNEKGFVHNTFFKSAAGDRNYAVCNCCPTCCVSLQTHRLLQEYSIPFDVNAHSGYLSRIDKSSCNGHGACAEICPFDAITVSHNQAKVDSDLCMGCGKCVDACPQKAIVLDIAHHKGIPLDLTALTS